MTNTALALLGFLGWTMILLVVMETLRTQLVVFKQIDASQFLPDNSNLSPFMQRLARAHANCIEGLPLFGGIMLLALATGHTDVTDPLASYFLLARLVQSCAHLISVSTRWVTFRFTCFAVQLAIGVYWLLQFALM